MPWLNWSLKFHIRLRTISLLISTHNTEVYIQWMPYSSVWLYLLKCVFTCPIFVDSNTKIFLSVLGFFGKYFIFTKTEKFQKQCCPILATQSRVIQVACYSCKLACWFSRLVRERKAQLRGVHRDFRGSAHNFLASRPSSRKKHLENFHIFGLWVFWRLALATCWRFTPVVKNACLAKTWSVFSLNFCDYSLSSPFLSQLKLTQTLLELHFCIISSQIFKKRYEFSLSHFTFHILSLLFLFYECIGVIMILSNVILIQGFALSWWLFIVWELVFLTLSLMFVCCLGSVHCFMIVVISFISCLWYSITLFVIWILVMLNGHLLLRYWCSSP